MREVAVDFGTSNTVAALRTGSGAAARLLSIDGWPVLPSAVWLAPSGELVVGRDAERQARLDPARYEPNPKRRIDEVEVLLGDTVVAVVDLIAAVLRRVLDEARRQLGGPPDRLVLTHPADWGAIRRSTLAAAARRAGAAGAVQLLPEPVAAAAHFTELPGHALAAGQSLAVYDLGGGTTDTAVVTRTAEGWQVLAEAGLGDVGGRDMDQVLLDHVGRQVTGRAGTDAAAAWQALLRPTDATSRRAARALADDVRAAKEALSRYPQADVPLPPPLPDVHVTRAELEDLVRPSVERTAALLSSTIAVAGLRPHELAGVYLVGGATRMPLVAQVLSARLGRLPVAVESPECSVVLGALAAPPQREITDPRTIGPLGAPPATPVAASAATPVAPFPPGTAFPPPPPRGRRRALVAVLAVLGVLALGGAATVAAAALRGDDPPSAGSTSTTEPTAPTTTSRSTTTSPPGLDLSGGDVQPPEPVQVPAEQREAPFGSDPELRAFAGQAVDRALNCVDPKGSAKAIFNLRTQVQCVYRLDDRLYYASFMSADTDQACEQFASVLVLYGRNVHNDQWSGGGRQGLVKQVELTIPTANNVVFYNDTGRKLCGLVEGDEERPLDRAAIHQQWNTVIRPGS